MGQALKTMPKGCLKVFNRIIKLDSDNKELWFSQVRLAEKLGLCLSTIKRALAYLKKHGIVQWTFRGVKRTCLYKLNDHLGSKAVRERFVKQLPNLKLIPMPILVSRNAVFLEHSTPAISSECLIENEPQCPSERILISKSLISKSDLSKSGKREIERLTESNIASVRARLRKRLASLFLSKNKEKEMSQYSQSVSMIEASGLQSFDPSAYGKIIVASFHHESIRFADEEIKKKKGTVQKPMALFCSLAKQHSEKNGLRGNFSRLQEFRKENPAWESMPELNEAPIPAPVLASKSIKSGTSGILKDGVRLPGLVEISALIKARNATESNELSIEADTVLQQHRDASTFDRVGEWMQFVLEGKRRLGVGQSVNPFWKREIDAYDAAHEQGASMQDMPIRAAAAIIGHEIIPGVVEAVVHEPLGSAQMKIISKILEHRDVLGHGESPQLVLQQINELVCQGTSHPLASDRGFWEGMVYVADVIDSQLASLDTIRYLDTPSGLDTAGDLDSIGAIV